MKFLNALFSESGEISCMRVMSMFALTIGAGIAVYGIHAGKDLSGVAQITGVFVVSAFGAKLGQKVVEK